jgi:hypothetical protein
MLFDRLYRFAEFLHATSRMNLAFARAAATAPLRALDPTRPSSWEFSGFSQNGEDGIIDYLLSRLREPNRTFIEVGSSDGIENNSAWLALAKRYSGLMVEGSERQANLCKRLVQPRALGVRVEQLFVEQDNAAHILKLAQRLDPDFFSLDIDGNDFHICRELFAGGLRPRICAFEYNATFGPERAVTIAYQRGFNYLTAHPQHLYFGASIAAWRRFMEARGYLFVTAESNGVNVFFIDPAAFDPDFVSKLRGDAFHDNFEQRSRLRQDWSGRFSLLDGMELVEV